MADPGARRKSINRLTKIAWAEEDSPILPSPVVASALAQNGEKRGWHFSRQGPKTNSGGQNPQQSPPGWQ